MAADLLKCGQNRVWMDPDRAEEIAKAVTRGDVSILINGGAITSKQITGISNARKKYALDQRKKGRRTGQGSRKGPKRARLPRKEQWIRTIRPLRAYLRTLRDDKTMDAHTYRGYYRKAKGGNYRSKQHLRSHLIADKIIKEDSP
jgi:large subunit ribosomal protein L19e